MFATLATIKVKETFYVWLSKGNAKYSPDVYLTCISKISIYLIKKKYIKVDLWKITNYENFNNIYQKVINDNAFRIKHKKTYAVFKHVGLMFLKFLDSKPLLFVLPPIDKDSISVSAVQNVDEDISKSKTVIENITRPE